MQEPQTDGDDDECESPTDEDDDEYKPQTDEDDDESDPQTDEEDDEREPRLLRKRGGGTAKPVTKSFGRANFVDADMLKIVFVSESKDYKGKFV